MYNDCNAFNGDTMKNILEQFEQMVNKFPSKTLFAEVDKQISFKDFKQKCMQVGSSIAQLGMFNKSIMVLDNRDINTLVAMFGVVYSGNHYVLLDSTSPLERLNKICNVIVPNLIVCSNSNFALATSLKQNLADCNILKVEDCTQINQQKLAEIRSKTISTHPVYILFTSGSTGVPKGTVVSHANLLAYVPWFASAFEIDASTIFASQTPFYFSASVSDIYSSLFYGATFNIIPKSYFSFPIQLVRFLNERQVNTIYWVPSALNIVANLKLFDYEKPKFLKKVMFIGEVMPNKQLNYWRNALPDVKFANLFGPTETVDVCTFYPVNRPFKDEESLPIGKPCENVETFVLDENGKLVTQPFKQGELYVRSAFVACGYYKNEEQTKKAFVQNPLQNDYPEIVYKTGDIVMLNNFGEYEYVGRVDFQIKHKGYRIELGEIERVASAIEKLDSVVALFDKDADKIILAYTGKIKKEDLFAVLTKKLPEYMLPESILKLNALPINANGKIDRKTLLLNYKTMEE